MAATAISMSPMAHDQDDRPDETSSFEMNDKIKTRYAGMRTSETTQSNA